LREREAGKEAAAITACDAAQAPPNPAMPPLRLLTYTTLYPHGRAPNLGVFVENRLRHLARGLPARLMLRSRSMPPLW